MVPSKYLKLWLESRLEKYREMHPKVISSAVMIAASGVAAIVAIAYAHIIEWATSMMILMSTQYRWYFLGTAPLFFIAAWALVRYFAPETGGSGIPQVLAEIERSSSQPKSSRSALKNLKLIAVKIVSSTLAVLGGGVVGREGPTIQISAAIFEMFDGVFKKYVSSHKSRETLLIAGGAAGLAAAFNTPLGGVVFAIEELASQHFKNFKGSLILSVVIAGYVTQAILGPYLFIGHPTIGLVTVTDTMWGLLVATAIGILGAGFGKGLYRIAQWVKRFSDLHRLIIAGCVGLIVSAVCIGLGTDASAGGSLLIQKLLFTTGQTSHDISWALAVWRVLGVAVTYISGCAGGIFAPSLAAGAALGAAFAQAFSFDNQNLIIVLAMIAFLTGATRSPFTSFILVFEMTDR
ncbi:MAG: chloride channel protein, partial [Proteobacteria bacterium]